MVTDEGAVKVLAVRRIQCFVRCQNTLIDKLVAAGTLRTTFVSAAAAFNETEVALAAEIVIPPGALDGAININRQRGCVCISNCSGRLIFSSSKSMNERLVLSKPLRVDCIPVERPEKLTRWQLVLLHFQPQTAPLLPATETLVNVGVVAVVINYSDCYPTTSGAH
jgi:hypothetical protein